MTDLLINLLASVIAGTAVWSAQRVLRHRRLARMRRFFGLDNGAACLLAVGRHASSPHELSVHRRDVAALVELATVARECGGRADLVADEAMPQLGRVTEFCVGGPYGNARTAAHLRAIFRGVAVTLGGGATSAAITVGATTYRQDGDAAHYALLGRARGSAGGRPVFVLAGQTAQSNLAAARFLATRHRQLYRSYGADRPFCLILRVIEPGMYGIDGTEVVADVSAAAFGDGPRLGVPPEPESRTGSGGRSGRTRAVGQHQRGAQPGDVEDA